MKGHVYRAPGRAVWMIAYYGPRPDGSRGLIRESSKTEDREKAEKVLEARIRSVRNHDDGLLEFKGPEAKRLTVGELLTDLLAFYRVRQIKGLDQVEYRLRKGSLLHEAFGHLRVSEVTPARLNGFILTMRQEKCENSTINRHLELLRRAFNVAVENRRLVRSMVPAFPKKLPENVRQETVTLAEHAKLVEHLPEPLDDVARFGWLTGWRRGQILGLRWAWVDMEAKEISVPGSNTKSGRAHTIPLDEDLVAIMKRQRARGVGCTWVFHRRGKPISRTAFTQQWESARTAAKLPTKRFHDYRRSMASEQRRSGTPEGVIMRLGGWQTRSMFDRYDIRNTDDLRAALARRKAHAAK